MVRNTLRYRPTSGLRALALSGSNGFTLIELLTVTAIIVIVSSIILVNNNRFGGVVQLENLTYDVALSIRQAQVYGISVERYGANDFSGAYGMHFAVGDPTHYELFADSDKDGFFSAGENVAPSPYTIRSGFKINRLCSPQGADPSSCTSVSTLDITFKRPESSAYIRKDGGAGIVESARIVLVSPRGDIMSVVVGANGQISVRRGLSQ